MEIKKLREVEKAYIVQTLEAKGGNRTHTARSLGIGIRTLQRKLKRYGMAEYLLVTAKPAATSSASPIA